MPQHHEIVAVNTLRLAEKLNLDMEFNSIGKDLIWKEYTKKDGSKGVYTWVSSVTINGYTFKGLQAWTSSDFDRLQDAMREYACGNIKTLSELENHAKGSICSSTAKNEQIIHDCVQNKIYKVMSKREYVKDSYRNSKENLITLLTTALNDSKYSQKMFESALCKASKLFTGFNSRSAVLYKGYYITPYTLYYVMRACMEGMTKDQYLQYLNRFHNDCKYVESSEDKKGTREMIANDCLNRLFNSDKSVLERLTMLDNFRFENQRAGV